MSFKLLRIQFENLRNFKDKLDIDLSAFDRVVNGSCVFRISKNVSTQNVMAFVGINATGKTTALRLVNMVLSLITKRKSLDQIGDVTSVIRDGSSMTVFFALNGMIYRLYSLFGVNEENELIFREEELREKTIASVSSKSKLFDFTDIRTSMTRNSFITKDNASLLHPDDSIAAIVAQNSGCLCFDTLRITNHNFLVTDDSIAAPYLSLLDKALDSVTMESSEVLSIKFKNDEELRKVVPFFADILISSGTIRGSQILSMAKKVLNHGGYLIIDELENHLNKKLVQLVINLFQDNETNPNGAVLLFSTHYAELLDSIMRKDNIIVFLKESDGACSAKRFSDVIKRNDIKKSDIILSNYIDGTSPSYEDIQAVKEFIWTEA